MSPARAADWSAFSEPLFERLGREQGLPNDVVGAIVQDQAGFIWFGTGGGLARYDGHRFRHYTGNAGDPGSLPDSYVTALHVDSKGVLWVGTNAGGLARFDAATDRFVRVNDGLLNLSILSILTDAQGRLWVGTVGGVHMRDPATGASRFYARRGPEPDIPPLEQIRDMVELPDGGLLLASGRGLVRIDPSGDVTAPVSLGGAVPADAPIQGLLRDSKGRLWVTGEFPGVAMWDPATGEQRLFNLPGDGEAAAATIAKHALAELAPDRIVIGTQGAGLAELDVASGHVTMHRNDPTLISSLVASDVRSLLVDRSGILWIGTWGGGVARRNPVTRAVLSVPASHIRADRLSDPQVRSLMLAGDGKLWAGLQANGIDILDPVTGGRDGIRPGTGGLPDGAVLSMETMPDGTVYIGTQRGLFRRRPAVAKLEAVPLPAPGANAAVWFLMRRDNVLWIATDGLVALDLATGAMNVDRTRLGDARSLIDNRLRLLAPGPDGGLWVGGNAGLHYRGADGGFQRIRNDPADGQSLSHNFVTAVLTDRKGRIWVGTLGGGLNILEAGWQPGQVPKFRRLGQADGLPTLLINALREDAAGRIWASTDAGLAVVNGDDLSIQALGRPDGVGVGSFWSNSATIDADGQMMFGGRDGLVVVKPSLLDAWRTLAPTVVTDLRVDGKPVPADIYNLPNPPSLSLLPDQRSLSVEFASLDYTAPDRTRFLYRLDGFEEQWMAGDGTHRHVAYANLSPGSYRLLVRGSNRAGMFAPEPLILPVTVMPAWWQTWWFRGLALLALGLAAWAIVQLRTLSLRRRQRELEREVDERTEVIARQKDKLAATLEDLRATQDRLVREEKLASLGRLVSGVAHEINTPLGVAITTSSFLSEEMGSVSRQVDGKALTRTALSDFLATGREAMGVLQANLQRAARLVQSFKQVSAEEYAGPRQRQRLSTLVAEAVAPLQPRLREKQVTFHLEGMRELTALVQPGAMVNVLTNLMLNALQHSWPQGGGGTLTVTLSAIEDTAVITIADDGVGMDDNVRAKAFDPFFTTTRDHGGTGLGLHIVHNLVAGPLSGSISLESAPGLGSRFIITLPGRLGVNRRRSCRLG
ncbi:two-component regulator propeller domain-containing protein [Niveispirillum sp. KHB5.9]|uniref:sensor histidine kinase n=1 Tax=Niveispirillum sp. KHB5.9 TaxID=3400269 RepID=UPI003A838FF4